MHLALGNKLYSSWSLRAYILLKAFDIEFDETVIAMYKSDTRERMLSFGPTGKVPVLTIGEITVWESLAIMDTIADLFPDKNIWPSDPASRAHARSAASEMHAGFMGHKCVNSCNLNQFVDIDELGFKSCQNCDAFGNLRHSQVCRIYD